MIIGVSIHFFAMFICFLIVYEDLKEIELFESNELYNDSERSELSIFPDFVVEYFAKIYGLQSILHQVNLIYEYYIILMVQLNVIFHLIFIVSIAGIFCIMLSCIGESI